MSCALHVAYMSAGGPLWADWVQRRVCLADGSRATPAYRQFRRGSCPSVCLDASSPHRRSPYVWSLRPVLGGLFRALLTSTVPFFLIQPCAQPSRTPTGAKVFQIGLGGVARVTQRPIWNSFATVGARDFREIGCTLPFNPEFVASESALLAVREASPSVAQELRAQLLQAVHSRRNTTCKQTKRRRWNVAHQEP